ncbi:MAG: universal stress protein [Firmicutes bacterium]|nr:universal stress protein [Bacillota bacterium]
MILQKALVAVDFSASSYQLLRSVEEYKPLGLREVVLVHVIDIRQPGGGGTDYKDFDKKLLNREKENLEALGLKVKVIVSVGFPASEIVNIAQHENVSVILISSRGNNILTGIFLGNTTADVMRTSTVPVLIDKGWIRSESTYKTSSKNRFSKVLVPVDFSKCSDYTLDQLKDMRDVVEEVVLVSVIERCYDFKQLEQMKSDINDKLAEIKGEPGMSGIKTDIYIGAGAASENILRLADEKEVSMIMMGTRGIGLIKGLLFGSTAEAVAHRAKVPVLLIPGFK